MQSRGHHYQHGSMPPETAQGTQPLPVSSGLPGSSSVNLEKAYEELEREIMEIKQKL